MSRLTLIEPAAFGILEERDPHMLAPVKRAMAPILDPNTADRVCAQELVTFWFGPGSWEASPEVLRSRVEQSAARIRDEVSRAAAFTVSDDELAGIHTPLHLICGTGSPAPARRVCELLAERVPRGRLSLLSGARHDALRTHAAELAALLL